MDAQTITVIITLIGILKGKDVWEYLRVRTVSKDKGNEKIINIYEKQIQDLEIEIKELKQKYEDLILRFQIKTFKSRGKRKEINN
jgi:hypothetical protein